LSFQSDTLKTAKFTIIQIETNAAEYITLLLLGKKLGAVEDIWVKDTTGM